jgi:hypothetical protein
MEREVVQRRACVGLGRRRPVGEWQACRRVEHAPALRAGDLEHEHVVLVVVDVEALRARRREVGVDLDRGAGL